MLSRSKEYVSAIRVFGIVVARLARVIVDTFCIPIKATDGTNVAKRSLLSILPARDAIKTPKRATLKHAATAVIAADIAHVTIKIVLPNGRDVARVILWKSSARQNIGYRLW